jgi:hypothetical protein
MPGWLDNIINVLSRTPTADTNVGGAWPTVGINPNEPYPGSVGGQTGGGGNTPGQRAPGGDWDWLWNILYGGANLFGTYMSERERKGLQNYIKDRIAKMDERAERRETERGSILQGALPSLYRGIGYNREQIARQMMNSPFMQNRVPGQDIQGAAGLANGAITNRGASTVLPASVALEQSRMRGFPRGTPPRGVPRNFFDEMSGGYQSNFLPTVRR